MCKSIPSVNNSESGFIKIIGNTKEGTEHQIKGF